MVVGAVEVAVAVVEVDVYFAASSAVRHSGEPDDRVTIPRTHSGSCSAAVSVTVRRLTTPDHN